MRRVSRGEARVRGHQLGSNTGSCVKVEGWRVRCEVSGAESQV